MKKSRPAGLPATKVWKPTKAQLLAAYGKRVPDVISPRLKVLFVGINPGFASARAVALRVPTTRDG